jgi:4-oxalocrotonate tautomerase family enzyme
MPYVTISASDHFSTEQKRQLLQRASDAVVESIGAPLASVRVMLHDLPKGYYLNAGQLDTDCVMFVVRRARKRSARAACRFSQIQHGHGGRGERPRNGPLKPLIGRPPVAATRFLSRAVESVPMVRRASIQESTWQATTATQALRR